MSKKSTDYKRQFNAEKYDRLYVTVPKGKKNDIEVYAAARDESVNAFINRAITETIERDAKKDGEKQCL